MASDNLTQLGRRLNVDKRSIDYVTRRIAENFPMIERTRDELAKDFAFYQEFYIYHETPHHVTISLFFQEEFLYNAVPYHLEVPHTFTTDDIGAWIPLGFLGDLNYEAMLDYLLILSYTSTGSFDMTFKASFDSGEVDITSSVTFSTNEIFVPLRYSELVSPPDTVLKGMYVYGKLNSLSGTLYISASTPFYNNSVYSPRIIGI